VILALLSVVGGALNLPYLHNFEHWLSYTFEAGEHGAEVAEAAVPAVEEAAHGVLGFTWGGLDPVLAIGSTLLALAAIGVGYYFYARRFQELQKLPVKQRPDDPMRAVIGPLFSAFENKYWVDEFYKLVILDTYTALAKFVAEVIDWRFWHDFFHDVVIAGGYRFISHTLLSNVVDTRGIDATANGLARGTQSLAALLRRLQTGLVRNYALAVVAGVVLILGYLSYTILR
jgi:NADH-quinone oxidoreductase subunit L